MYWTEVVEQLFSDAMLGFAEKAECWPISLKKSGDDNMAAPGKITGGRVRPPVDRPMCYQKIANKILSAIITD
jgi:hypothetical protein